MFDQLVLGVVSLWNQSFSGIKHIEEDIVFGSNPIEVTAPMEFTALGIHSDQPLPPIYYRAGYNETWRMLHADHEFDNETELLSGNPRRTIQLKSDKAFEGEIIWMDTRISGETLVAKFDPFDDDSGDDPLTGLPKKINPPRYIARSEWGADEGLRTWKPFRGLNIFFRDIVPEAKKLPPMWRPQIISYKDEEGKKLTWPVEKNKVLKKMIIHHTGEVIDESRNPMELMRAIYAYHTLSRGWGDIGYNYVIDQKGNIYEGRSGGPLIVGAHTAFHNVGSLGVALMGNFNKEEPTEAQLHVLTLLLADHAKRFRINPYGRSDFLEKKTYNIMGHRHAAARGHGTACPGKNIVNKLKWIRKETGRKLDGMRDKPKTSRDFLAKSVKASLIQRYKKVVRKEKIPVIDMAELIKNKVYKRGQKVTLQVKIRNGSKYDWPVGAELQVKDVPDGLLFKKFRSYEKIRRGHTGIFRAKMYVKDTPNGKYELTLVPRIFHNKQDVIFDNFTFKYPIQISGSKGLLLKRSITPRNQKSAMLKQFDKTKSVKYQVLHAESSVPDIPEIKVKLSYFDHKIAYIISDRDIHLFSQNKFLETVPTGTRIKVFPSTKRNKINIAYGEKKHDLFAPQLKTDGIFEILNYDRGMGSLKYNTFRKQINVHLDNKDGESRLMLVNQLPLNEYLYGLGEEPSTEPTEKKHAIHILARSYGLVYSGVRRKFGTDMYDLEDSPRTSQLYLGYEWEKYHPDQKKLIEETYGKVITYDGKPVIGPYFTQSGGENSGKWRSQYPWTKQQKLPFDEGLNQRGHGVGLSGNTARKLAKMGRTYGEILDYFFDGIEVKKVY